MTLVLRRAGLAALLACTAACSESWGNDNSAPVDITVTENATSDLTLWVSNQSFVDRTVDVTVTLDGATIIDRGFNVGDQHNFIEHRIRLHHGSHTLTASTVIDGEPVELSEEFTIDAGQQHFAALTYSHYVPTRAGDTSFDPPGFNFLVQDDPIGFA